MKKNQKSGHCIIPGIYIYCSGSCSSTSHSTGSRYSKICEVHNDVEGKSNRVWNHESVKSDQILNLKCSNTNVATVKKEKFIDDYTITIKS